MRASVTQSPPEPQCPLPSHIIAGNHLAQLENLCCSLAGPRTQDTKPLLPRPGALPSSASARQAGRSSSAAALIKSIPPAPELEHCAGTEEVPGGRRRGFEHALAWSFNAPAEQEPCLLYTSPSP